MEEIIKLLLVEDDANLCYIIQGGLEDMIGGYSADGIQWRGRTGRLEGTAAGCHRSRH